VEQPVDEPMTALAEVGAEPYDASVDAGLDLALEERRVAELRTKRDLVSNEANGFPRRPARRIEPEIAEQHQCGHAGPPVRRIDSVAPVAVRALAGEELGAPTLRRHARTFRGHDFLGFMGEVLHDLPADRRIRIEQPFDDGF